VLDLVPCGLQQAVTAGVTYLQKKGWLDFNNSSGSSSESHVMNTCGHRISGRGDNRGRSILENSKIDLGQDAREEQRLTDNCSESDAAHNRSACERAVYVFLSTVFDASDEAFYSGEYLAHGTGTGMALALFRVASRLNHSCLPNCWWRVEEGKHMVNPCIGRKKWLLLLPTA